MLLLSCHPEKRKEPSPIPKIKASSYGLLPLICGYGVFSKGPMKKRESTKIRNNF